MENIQKINDFWDKNNRDIEAVLNELKSYRDAIKKLEKEKQEFDTSYEKDKQKNKDEILKAIIKERSMGNIFEVIAHSELLFYAEYPYSNIPHYEIVKPRYIDVWEKHKTLFETLEKQCDITGVSFQIFDTVRLSEWFYHTCKDRRYDEYLIEMKNHTRELNYFSQNKIELNFPKHVNDVIACLQEYLESRIQVLKKEQKELKSFQEINIDSEKENVSKIINLIKTHFDIKQLHQSKHQKMIKQSNEIWNIISAFKKDYKKSIEKGLAIPETEDEYKERKELLHEHHDRMRKLNKKINKHKKK